MFSVYDGDSAAVAMEGDGVIKLFELSFNRMDSGGIIS